MITIVNYGLGNIGSIQNMLKRIGVKSKISESKEDVINAEKLILPGVGAFDKAIQNIFERNLFDALNFKALNDKVPILGICLGMQLLAKSSEEGSLSGFGWIDAKVKRFSFGTDNQGKKIPHMGWNNTIIKNKHSLFQGLEHTNKFYFVHSYHIVCEKEENILSVSNYGYDFVSSVVKDNIFGVQFHPEKSHKYGMELLRNFGAL